MALTRGRFIKKLDREVGRSDNGSRDLVYEGSYTRKLIRRRSRINGVFQMRPNIVTILIRVRFSLEGSEASYPSPVDGRPRRLL